MKRSLAAAFLCLALAWPLAAAGAEESVYRLSVDGLACPFCAYGVEKSLNAIPGVSGIAIDIRSGHLTVRTTADGGLDEGTARRAVEAAGFSLRGFEKIPGRP